MCLSKFEAPVLLHELFELVYRADFLARCDRLSLLGRDPWRWGHALVDQRSNRAALAHLMHLLRLLFNILRRSVCSRQRWLLA